MNRVIHRIHVAMLCCLGALAQAHASDATELMDFTHVRLALQYFVAPSQARLDEISGTSAAQHLKRHSDRTGYYPADATSRDITADLVREAPSDEVRRAVESLVAYASGDRDAQAGCFDTASAYLPDTMRPVAPLYATWGYDIGVAMDGHASLNFTHRHFLANPREIWFYCIHEVHHAGLTQVHRMPRIAGIATVAELLAFTRYATFLEGLAVHAARAARAEAHALADDRDYRALEDPPTLERILARYRDRIAFLESEVNRSLRDEHWAVVEEMSSGERLWYVVGAYMAATIQQKYGRSRLLQVTAEGPESFVAAYGAASASAM